MLLLSILNLASRLTTSNRRVKTRCPADLPEMAVERCLPSSVIRRPSDAVARTLCVVRHKRCDHQVRCCYDSGRLCQRVYHNKVCVTRFGQEIAAAAQTFFQFLEENSGSTIYRATTNDAIEISTAPRRTLAYGFSCKGRDPFREPRELAILRRSSKSNELSRKADRPSVFASGREPDWRT